MNIRNTIVKHYKKFFDLHAKGIALTEDDHLDIDWAESLVKDCFIPDVIHWVATSEKLPPENKEVMVWLALEKYYDYDKIGKHTTADEFKRHYSHWRGFPEPPCV